MDFCKNEIFEKYEISEKVGLLKKWDFRKNETSEKMRLCEKMRGFFWKNEIFEKLRFLKNRVFVEIRHFLRFSKHYAFLVVNDVIILDISRLGNFNAA